MELQGGMGMSKEQPLAIVLGGINGAGKTTASQALIAEQLAVMSFVNADTIARGLNAFSPESVAFEAGKVTLERLRELRKNHVDFAFETTLSGRSYISLLRGLREDGYVIELYYFWLRSPDLAVERVRARVKRGGHNIPETTIRQRYMRSLQNFWNDYRFQADSWFVYDNSLEKPILIAAGCRGGVPLISKESHWKTFLEVVDHA